MRRGTGVANCIPDTVWIHVHAPTSCRLYLRYNQQHPCDVARGCCQLYRGYSLQHPLDTIPSTPCDVTDHPGIRGADLHGVVVVKPIPNLENVPINGDAIPDKKWQNQSDASSWLNGGCLSEPQSKLPVPEWSHWQMTSTCHNRFWSNFAI